MKQELRMALEGAALVRFCGQPIDLGAVFSKSQKDAG